MFGFLKDKLKKAISKFTGDVKEEVAEKVEKIPEQKQEEISKKKIVSEKHEEKKPEVKKDEKKKETKHFEEKKETEKTKPKEDPRKIKEEKSKHQEAKHEERMPQKEYSKKEEDKITHEEKLHSSKEEKREVEDIKEEKKEIKKENIEIKKHEEKIKNEASQKKEIAHEKPNHHIKKEEIRLPETKETLHEKKQISKNIAEEKKEELKKHGFFGKLKQTFQPKPKEEKIVDVEKLKEDEKEVTVKDEAVEEKKGFFDKLTEVVTKKTLSESKFEDLFFELEITLLENNVAVEVIEKIKSDLKKTLLSERVSRIKTEEVIAESLKKSIEELFDVEKIDLLKEIKKKKPYVICFIGVNGSGKTTNLAKLANYLQKRGVSVVIAACDTFRAAAIQQIEEHAKNLDIKLVKHDYGADAAAVAYDAIEHAKAKGKDVVLIDTAGRSHANTNLMEELQKVIRVSKPDMKIFVGDSLTGNDAVEQGKTFNEKIGIDGIILSKVDVDEKGGAAISVSYVTQKPIMFIGTGQTYDDLEEFEKTKIIKNIGF